MTQHVNRIRDSRVFCHPTIAELRRSTFIRERPTLLKNLFQSQGHIFLIKLEMFTIFAQHMHPLSASTANIVSNHKVVLNGIRTGATWSFSSLNIDLGKHVCLTEV